MKLRFILGILFLVLQIASVVYARFIPERFFCWGPYDNQTNYNIAVTIDNKQLSLDEIHERYRYKSHGWEQRTIHNVFAYVSQYEATYGIDDNAKIVITYSTNGRAKQKWTYQN